MKSWPWVWEAKKRDVRKLRQELSGWFVLREQINHKRRVCEGIPSQRGGFFKWDWLRGVLPLAFFLGWGSPGPLPARPAACQREELRFGPQRLSPAGWC